MKFLLFSDLHHRPGVFHGGTLEDLQTMQTAAVESGCEFMIHAGDFCHGPSQHMDYVAAYHESPIPVYHCLGGHDSDNTPLPDTVAAYRMPGEYYYFDHGGYRMIVTNTNYYKEGENYIAYHLGNYYAHPEDREYLPPEQLVWLEETIAASPYPCILFSHASLERPDGVQNRAAVQQIINAANAQKPHSVLMCINGHHHRDFVRLLGNVLYWDVNSVSYDWVENAHDLYPKADREAYSLIHHTVVYNEPLYAIVTIEGTRIRAEGVIGSMYLGITREMTGNQPFDRAGRPVTPEIRSFDITL